MINHIALWIATCGPIGRIKRGPGSVASAAAVFLIVPLSGHPLAFLVFLCLMFLIAVWSSQQASIDLGEKDPSVVVIDEVCGMMVSFLFISINWQRLLLGFFAFRFFDIVKPSPIRLTERLPKGFGIVLDDVVAGIYSNLLIRFLIHYAHL